MVKDTEDDCATNADIDVVRELMEHQVDALKELIDTKIEGLKEFHEQLRREAEQGKTEMLTRMDSLRNEFSARLDGHDEQIQSLREGRSTDKGRMLGQEPWLKLVFYVVGGILLAAALAFIGGRASAPPSAPSATHGERR